MTLDFHWFLPTYGDSRQIVGGGHGVPAGMAGGARPASIAYLGQIARSAEQLGFIGALTPTGAWCEDAWLATAMLVEVTESLKFLVAFRPGLISPTLSAQMAATFQRHSGRLLLNVVVGGEAHEQHAYGDFLSKDERYERADEFLTIVRRLWAEGKADFAGKHLRVEGATIPRLPDPVPPLYFGGSSGAAGPVAADHSDVYLTWGEPLEAVAKKVAWIKGLAAARGRTLRYGIRLHVIARDTSEQAWAEAERLLQGIDPETIRSVQAGLARSESEGQKRMIALHGGSTANLEIAPNLWAGVGLVRGGAGTALVGSHREVAERIREYAEVGIDEFVLSGVPHLEEAYWFGEGVLPLLERDGLWVHPRGREQASGPADVPFAPAAVRERVAECQLMADALTDLDEADGLLRNVAGHLRSADKAGDAGSLLKIGRLQARLQAGRALARTGRPDEAGAFAVDLLLEIGRAFPPADGARRVADEDAHLRFEAIGRRVFSQGVPL